LIKPTHPPHEYYGIIVEIVSRCNGFLVVSGERADFTTEQDRDKCFSVLKILKRMILNINKI